MSINEGAAPEIPPAGEHLWGWFWRLNSQRSLPPPPVAGAQGATPTIILPPLAVADIAAFGDLFGLSVRPWEAAALTAMDQAWRLAVRQSPGQKMVPATSDNIKRLFRSMKGPPPRRKPS